MTRLTYIQTDISSFALRSQFAGQAGWFTRANLNIGMGHYTLTPWGGAPVVFPRDLAVEWWKDPQLLGEVSSLIGEDVVAIEEQL